jgi:Holliday junction resolvasome RuvABC endonuclease subunit
MRIVIGIDESYTKTGLALIVDKVVVKSKSISFANCKTKTDKRNCIRRILPKIIEDALGRKSQPTDKVLIICERIRTFSGSYGLRPAYLISTGALIATIVDVAAEYNINVYSVDTAAWKTQIVGSSKGEKKQVLITRGPNKGKYKEVTDNKRKTLEWVKNKLGIDCKGDDDRADSICIGLYGFVRKSKRNLKKEE